MVSPLLRGPTAPSHPDQVSGQATVQSNEGHVRCGQANLALNPDSTDYQHLPQGHSQNCSSSEFEEKIKGPSISIKEQVNI